ncbi:uncharacterized protein At3g17950 [Dendrobium catenatum]|uniref:Uncharacterized protein n=1 Tax=Dendrobium catenatum TaxID=906689 RepID=A0A2I0WJA0_9ASPA|nr:uncharacterized protein At3g17950 [Dendrobium catenatum]PKU75740.1 Uncharacterized protein MA16_Dca015620 [Dendrobium catenatum]
MDRNTGLFPSSPTNSSPSSSDLDTESTGSFFPDRSMTLGTLMGLTCPEIQSRVGRPPLAQQPDFGGPTDSGVRKQKARRTRRRRGGSAWWRLCRDEVGPTSLEEFLRAERQMGVAEADFIYGREENEVIGGGRMLFQNGRVLPPSPLEAAVGWRQRGRQAQQGGAKGRLPVLIAGICSGGEG